VINTFLETRAVSVPEDEVLCLFCNMGLDMELVMSTPPGDRLAVFWRNVRKIPVGLVFSNAPKKMSVPGLRWAPTSFLGSLDRTFWYIEQCLSPRRDGFVTEYGLQIQVPALLCDPSLLLWDDSYELFFENGTKLNLTDEEGYWYFVEPGDFWHQERTERPKENEVLAILHVQHVEDFDTQSTAATGQSTGDPFDFKLSIHSVLGIVEDPVSSRTEYGEESCSTGEGVRVLDRPPGTPEPRDLPRFRGYRHLSLHRHSDALSAFYRTVALVVELFVAFECGIRPRFFDDSEEELDLLSKLIRQQYEEAKSPGPGDDVQDSRGAPRTTGTTSTRGNEDEGDDALTQSLKELKLGGVSEEPAKKSKEIGTSNLQLVDQIKEHLGSDRQNSDLDDSATYTLWTDDHEVVQSHRETPDTYTLKEASRDECERFANTYIRSQTHARNIALAVGANAGRDEETTFDHFAKSARSQLQMRRRNVVKRLKSDTWWIID
jgi:hypothetical protein